MHAEISMVTMTHNDSQQVHVKVYYKCTYQSKIIGLTSFKQCKLYRSFIHNYIASY